ncbi:MAG: hypothetical protein ACC631_00550 [Halocynthiibacter sp.]
MTRIRELGTRVEMMPVDKTCHDISIGLYKNEKSAGPEFLVFSYANYEGTAERLAHVSSELQRLAGLERVGNSSYLRFACGSAHVSAVRRIFTRVCRAASLAPVIDYPLSVFDKKGGCKISAVPKGEGVYTFHSDTNTPPAERRTRAVMNGLCKLTKMTASEDDKKTAGFDCKSNHDDLIAMLLPDAINVRIATREQDEISSGGVLSAPGNAD